MKRLHAPLLFLFALLVSALGAQAAITCTITGPGFSTAYVPSNPGTNITQTSFTVTCQRNAGGDPTFVNWTAAANNGIHAAGAQNRVQLGATTNRMNYEMYQDGGCATLWGPGGANRIAGSVTGLSGFLPGSVTISVWGCVGAGQLGKPTGTYTDTVTMTLRNAGTGTTLDTGTFPVSAFTPAVCNITTPPGNVVFTYVAFGPVANASTTYGVTCTNLLPYTMALDATVGVVSGLQYTLSLSASSNTGSGLEQGYAINGTMPAGQAGTCATASCAGTQTRTLTITY